MSTQMLQPLIWLARSSTRPSVRAGTPALWAVIASVCAALMASGMSSAMFLMRDSLGIWFSLSHRFDLVRHCYDERGPTNVTEPETELDLANRFENHRRHLRAVAYRM